MRRFRWFGGRYGMNGSELRMDREIVDSLLCLLDESVAVDLPAQLLGLAIDLLECLVDRDGPDRHGELRIIHSRVA